MFSKTIDAINFVRMNPTLFHILSSSLKDNKTVAIIAIIKNRPNVKYVSERLLDDIDIIRLAIHDKNVQFLQYASKRLLSSVEFFRECLIEYGYSVVEYFTSDLLSDYENQKLAIQNGWNRSIKNKEFIEHRELAFIEFDNYREHFCKNPTDIEMLEKYMNTFTDFEFLLKAVRSNPNALRYIDSSVSRYKELCFESVKSNACSFRDIKGHDMVDNMKYLFVQEKNIQLYNIPPEVLANFDLEDYRIFIKNNPSAYIGLNEIIKEDPEIVKSALEHDRNLLEIPKHLVTWKMIHHVVLNCYQEDDDMNLYERIKQRFDLM